MPRPLASRPIDSRTRSRRGRWRSRTLGEPTPARHRGAGPPHRAPRPRVGSRGRDPNARHPASVLPRRNRRREVHPRVADARQVLPLAGRGRRVTACRSCRRHGRCARTATDHQKRARSAPGGDRQSVVSVAPWSWECTTATASLGDDLRTTVVARRRRLGTETATTKPRQPRVACPRPSQSPSPPSATPTEVCSSSVGRRVSGRTWVWRHGPRFVTGGV